MSNPFDLISNELGIAQGIPREYAAQFSAQQQAAAAAAAGQQMMQMRGIANNAAPMAGYVPQQATSSRKSRGAASKGANDGIDKTERRRKREREAARRSRQRKQFRLEGLSKRVEELERENAELRKQIQWSNVESLVKEREEVIVKLQRVLEDSSMTEKSTNSEVVPLITAFNNVSEQIVNLNAKGAESMVASLDKSHLVTVVLWMFISAENEKKGGRSKVKEEDDANREVIRKIGSKMNQKIREDIGLDDTQYAAILEARGKYYESFKAAYDQNKQALALVEELEQRRAGMAHYLNVTKSFREHVLQKVLSETQQAKLLVWLHRHKNLLRHLFSSSGSDGAA